MTQPDSSGDTPKHAGGRPTSYDPSMCQRAIELGKEGKSIEAIAGYLGVVTKTLYNWRDQHPEFLHAMEAAKEAEMIWWEQIAQDLMVEKKDGTRLNASIWSRSMAARFPSKYRESSKVELTGADGQPLIKEVKMVFEAP